MNKRQDVNEIAICVAGWHFNLPFYKQLLSIVPENVWVISHRPPEAFPEWLLSGLGSDQIIQKPNVGYDWGCYQQFIQLDIWRNYKYVFFMHDDLTIKDSGFIDHCIKILEDGKGMVGNGRVAPRKNWPDTHPECYAHSKWKPPSRDFEHDVVRGSFFAMSHTSLEKTVQFEVFWDRFRLTSGFGNWSTRASCARIEDLWGDKAFAFLSEEYLESEYLLEHVRGHNSDDLSNDGEKNGGRRVQIIRLLSRSYMNVYWKENWQVKKTLVQAAIGSMLNPFSRR